MEKLQNSGPDSGTSPRIMESRKERETVCFADPFMGVSMYPTALKRGKSEQGVDFSTIPKKQGLKAVGVKLRRFVFIWIFSSLS